MTRLQAAHNQETAVITVTWGGAARASEVNDVASSVCAGHVNTSIASAKPIIVGDLNLFPRLTLYDVYRVGTSNVPRSYETTPWAGAYPAGRRKRLPSGASGPVVRSCVLKRGKRLATIH